MLLGVAKHDRLISLSFLLSLSLSHQKNIIPLLAWPCSGLLVLKRHFFHAAIASGSKNNCVFFQKMPCDAYASKTNFCGWRLLSMKIREFNRCLGFRAQQLQNIQKSIAGQGRSCSLEIDHLLNRDMLHSPHFFCEGWQCFHIDCYEIMTHHLHTYIHATPCYFKEEYNIAF